MVYGWRLLVTGVLCFAGTDPTQAQQASDDDVRPDSVTVAILHSNDVYGRLNRSDTEDGLQGGMAPRLHILRQAGDNGPVLVLDAGNALGPDPLSVSDEGATMIDLMRLGGYTAMLPANHEMDFGFDVLKRQQRRAIFPFIATNIQEESTGVSPFDRFHLIETAGPRIGLLGVISKGTAQDTDPRHLDGIRVLDPLNAAASTVSALQKAGAHYIVALTNMDVEDTWEFAAKTEGIHLVIAGGHRRADREEHVNVLTRMVNGVQIVTTPRYGHYLGQIDVLFIRQPDTSYRPVRTDAFLHRVDAETNDDPAAAALVAQAKMVYERADQDTLGVILDDGPYEQALLVAEILRVYGRAEISVINRGLVEQVATTGSFLHRDINRIILYPVTVNTMKLKGVQIRALAARSSSVRQESRRLIFGGLDTDAMTVNGRALVDQEPYEIATIDFLAQGGDGYRTFTDNPSFVETNVGLRQIMVEAFQERRTLSHEELRREGHRGVWHSSWQLEAGFERNYVDKTTAAYQAQNEAVAYLGGVNTVSWNGAMRYILQHEAGRHTTRFDTRMDFGEWGTSFRDLEPFSDHVDAELRFRYRTLGKKGDPFLSIRYQSAFGNAGNQRRPSQVFGSLGYEFRPASKLSVRIAGRRQHNFVVGKSDTGGELILEWSEPLYATGSNITTQFRGFVAPTDRRTISIENYNTVSFSLLGRFRVNVRQSNFFFRVNQVPGTTPGDFAFRTYITVGLGYGVNWKWR